MDKKNRADFPANMEELNKLFLKAKGNLSRAEMVERTGLSTALVSRMINGRLVTPPVPSSLKKIANGSVNHCVSYKELLEAAGYEPEKYISAKELEEVQDKKFTTIAHLATATMSLHLTNLPEPYFMTIPSGNDSIWDLIGEGLDGTKWYFDYILEFDYSRAGLVRNNLSKHLGDYLFNAVANDKISIVTNSETYFDYLSQHKPLPIKANLSVILIDTSALSVIKEETIS